MLNSTGGSDPECYKVDPRFLTAGNLPESVRTCYDLLGAPVIKSRFLGLIFERHSIQHHAFFTDESFTYDTTQDFKAVLFPPIMLLFFNGCFALPVGALLYLLVSPNVSFLFVLTAILYFLNYELLHFAYHMDPQSWVGRLPFMDGLRTHHSCHHDKRLMTRYNFNITYPICDYLFGTIYKDSS